MKIIDVSMELYCWFRKKFICNGRYVYLIVGLDVVKIEIDDGFIGLGLLGGVE